MSFLRRQQFLLAAPIFIGGFRYFNFDINLTALYILTIVIFCFTCKNIYTQIFYLILSFFPFWIYSLFFMIDNGTILNFDILSFYLFSIFAPVAFSSYVRNMTNSQDHLHLGGTFGFLVLFYIFVLFYSEGNVLYRGSVYQFSGDWILLFLFFLVISKRINFKLMCIILLFLILLGSRAALLTSFLIIMPYFRRPWFVFLILSMLIIMVFVDFSFLFNHFNLRVLIDIIGIFKSDPMAVIMRGIDDRFDFHRAAMSEFYQNPIWGNYGYALEGQYAHSFANILASWGLVGAIAFCLPFLLLVFSRVVNFATCIWVLIILFSYSLFRTPETFFYPGVVAITLAEGMIVAKNRSVYNAV